MFEALSAVDASRVPNVTATNLLPCVGHLLGSLDTFPQFPQKCALSGNCDPQYSQGYILHPPHGRRFINIRDQ